MKTDVKDDQAQDLRPARSFDDYYVIETHNWGTPAALELIQDKIDALAKRHKLTPYADSLDDDFLAKAYRTYDVGNARAFSSAARRYGDEVIDIRMLECFGPGHDMSIDFYYASKDFRKWQGEETPEYRPFADSKANKLLGASRAG